MNSTQGNANKKDTKNKEKETPWLKIFLAIIAVLIVLNGIKSVIGNVGEKRNNKDQYADNSVENSANDSNGIFDTKKERVKNTIDALAIEESEIVIDGIVHNEAESADVEFITYSGSLTDEKSEDTYEFSIPREGRYRFDFSDIVSPGKVKFTIYDSLEKKVADRFCSTGDGLTQEELKAGENYTLVVAMYNAPCDYTLTIWQQKEEIDLSSYTSIKDSVEFIDQENIYLYTVPVDGRLRLEVNDLQGSSRVRLTMRDSLDQNVLDIYCGNGDGKAVTDLKAGDTYKIHISQSTELSSYKLGLYSEKADVDVSDYNVIKDSIEFVDQSNVYRFTVPVDGRYRFEFAEIKAGFRLHLRIFDANRQSIADTYCGNNEGSTVNDWKAGEQYEIQVVQDSDMGEYTLKIGKQKDSIDVDGSTMVNDSIQYTEQRNVYLLQGEEGKSYLVTVKNMNADQQVDLAALDALGYEIDSRSYTNTNDTITINPLESSQEISIEVCQRKGAGNYSIEIQEQ